MVKNSTNSRRPRASVLAATLIILAAMLAIAMSISLVSIQERKASIGSNDSSLAYQEAESGIENVMQKIKSSLKNDPGGKVDGIATPGQNPCGVVIAPGKYKVELKDSSGNVITDCTADVSSIDKIKSIGYSGQNSRAIETSVVTQTAVSCATQIFDQALTNDDATGVMVNDQERGQSFRPAANGALYSITLRRRTNGSAVAIQFRTGPSSNLSVTYDAQFNCTVPAVAGEFECIIPAADRPVLTAGTTHHFLFRAVDNSQSNWDMSRDDVDTAYGNGRPYFDSSRDWVGTNGTADLYFKTKMCV